MFLSRHFLPRQRGAMFGLDARIALAIMAILSIVAGMTVVLSITDIRGKALSKELVLYKTAFESMQYDLKTGIYDAVNSGADMDTRSFAALYDRSEIKTAYQPKWLGPYVKRESTIHPEYGQMYLLLATQTDPTDTVCGSSCYYWIRIDGVSQAVFNHTNDAIDGTAEASPESEGKVMWAYDNVNDINILYYRFSRSL